MDFSEIFLTRKEWNALKSVAKDGPFLLEPENEPIFRRLEHYKLVRIDVITNQSAVPEAKRKLFNYAVSVRDNGRDYLAYRRHCLKERITGGIVGYLLGILSTVAANVISKWLIGG